MLGAAPVTVIVGESLSSLAGNPEPLMTQASPITLALFLVTSELSPAL